MFKRNNHYHTYKPQTIENYTKLGTRQCYQCTV